MRRLWPVLSTVTCLTSKHHASVCQRKIWLHLDVLLHWDRRRLYLLTRWEQETVFRLRTGHNRLNHHLYSKLCISHTEQCPCGTGSQTSEKILQSCLLYEALRKGIWPDHTPVSHKRYGSLGDLWCTAIFIEETRVSIWWMERRKSNQPTNYSLYLTPAEVSSNLCFLLMNEKKKKHTISPSHSMLTWGQPVLALIL